MRSRFKTLDDLLSAVFQRLLDSTVHINPTRGPAKEIYGSCVVLNFPRHRLSATENRGKVFSALGEFLWYMSGSDNSDFIKHYIPAYKDEHIVDGKVYGAYGPRLFSWREHNQVERVCTLLTQKSTTRRAVIQVLDCEDIASDLKGTPCTSTLQFLYRDKALHLIVHMRSSDAYKGLMHDIFCFTMLQEYMARRLGFRVGTYTQLTGSLHLYESDGSRARDYLASPDRVGLAMPPMPMGDPQPGINWLLRVEENLRVDGTLPENFDEHGPYWADLARLLAAFRFRNDWRFCRKLKTQFDFAPFARFVRYRPLAPPKGTNVDKQPEFSFAGDKSLADSTTSARLDL